MLNTTLVKIYRMETRVVHLKYANSKTLLLKLDIRVKIFPGTFNVTGTDLWKVSLWEAHHGLVTGSSWFYEEQALDDKQAATPLVTTTTDVIRLKFTNIDVIYHIPPRAVCINVNYICARFAQVDSNDPRYKVVGVSKTNGKAKVIKSHRVCSHAMAIMYLLCFSRSS